MRAIYSSPRSVCFIFPVRGCVFTDFTEKHLSRTTCPVNAFRPPIFRRLDVPYALSENRFPLFGKRFKPLHREAK